MTALNEPTIAADERRPTRVEVDLDVLADNYRVIAAHVAPARVMPILKANAYGHGLVEVARVLERLGAPYVGVAYLEEGLRLRQHGVRLPVLVLGGILGSQIPRFLEADLTLTASSVDKLRAIEEHAARAGRTATVHLKIDTGMERIGVHWYSAEMLLEESLRCRHVRVEGIFTHFANGDARDLAHARLQLERFHETSASTSAARCRRRCATRRTRARSCSCVRATWISCAPASSSTVSGRLSRWRRPSPCGRRSPG